MLSTLNDLNRESRLSGTTNFCTDPTAPGKPAHASDSAPVGWEPPSPSNEPAPHLSRDPPPSNIDVVVHRGQQAWVRLKNNNSWLDWLDVGRAHVIGRQECMRLAQVNEPSGHRYKGHFGEWLKKFGFNDIDKGNRARLFQVMDNLPAIEKWRATLTTTQRLDLNHPNSVVRKWQAATAPPPIEKEPKPSKLALTEQSLATALEENAKLKKEIDNGGGDLWTVHDRPEDIAAVMADKLSPTKFDRLIEAMKKIAKKRLDRVP